VDPSRLQLPNMNTFEQAGLPAIQTTAPLTSTGRLAQDDKICFFHSKSPGAGTISYKPKRLEHCHTEQNTS